MPRILHNPPTQFILQRCLSKPLPKPFVITLRPLMHLPPRDTKLRAARHAHFLRDLDAGKQLHEARLEILPRMDILAVCIAVRSNLRRASENPGAAQVDIALFLEVGDLETVEHRDAVVVGVVVMPLISLGMDEEHGFGETVIVIDDISESVKNKPLHGVHASKQSAWEDENSRQVYHRLPPLIPVHGQFCALIVHHVNTLVPIREVLE